MEQASSAQRVLLVTGLSGAGKSTVLRTLEDLGYEAVDNLPLSLLPQLLAAPEDMQRQRPLALCIDTRTRAFDPHAIVEQVKVVRAGGRDIRIAYIDCTGQELVRRFSETRRRHPLAGDRPASDAIAREREMLAPLRRWADVVIDSTDESVNDLRRRVALAFGQERQNALTLTIMSFGFARGLPRDADLVFDMRFLRNPHWDPALRPLTGRDPAVQDYVRADPAFAPAFDRIVDLLLTLLPGYRSEGKAYLTVAFGCTGGKHRSVFVTEAAAERLAAAGWQATVVHRDRTGDHGAAPDDDRGPAGESVLPAGERVVA